MIVTNDNLRADFLKTLLDEITVVAKDKTCARPSIVAGRLWVKALCKLKLGMLHQPAVHADCADGSLGLTFTRPHRSVEIVFDDNASMVWTLNLNPKKPEVTFGYIPETPEQMQKFWDWITT